MKQTKKVLGNLILFLSLANMSFAETVRYRLSVAENLRESQEDGVLTPVARLPKGTVIEVDDGDLAHPLTNVQYNCDSRESGPCDKGRINLSGKGFVKNIRVISIPSGTTRADEASKALADFVKMNPDAPLYLSKVTLDNMTVRVSKQGEAGNRRRLKQAAPVLAEKSAVETEDQRVGEQRNSGKQETSAVCHFNPLDPAAPVRALVDVWNKQIEPAVQALMNTISRVAQHNNPGSSLHCVRGVKQKLVASGAVRGFGDHVGNAPQLRDFLLAHGWRKIPVSGTGMPAGWRSLRDAPQGAVLIFTSPEVWDGDATIRTRGGFASDFLSDHPITGEAAGVNGVKTYPVGGLVWRNYRHATVVHTHFDCVLIPPAPNSI